MKDKRSASLGEDWQNLTPKEQWRPNWKNADEYPAFESTTKDQWAWEFLRRNTAFQQAWTEFKRTGNKPPIAELRARFGVDDLCAPGCIAKHDGVWLRESEHESRWRLLAFEQFPEIAYTTWTDKNHALKSGEQALQEFCAATQPQAPEEVIVKFNVLHDLDAQINALRMLLEPTRQLIARQYYLIDSPKRDQLSVSRPRREYQLYLRLLDAESSLDARSDLDLLRKVQPVLAPTLDDTVDSALRKLRNNLNQARRMRDFGYRSLCLVTDMSKFRLPPLDEKGRPRKASGNKKSLRDPRSRRFQKKEE